MIRTEAESYLVQVLVAHMSDVSAGEPRLLNIGAADSLSIERQLVDAGLKFVADRVDIDVHHVREQFVGRTWTSSVENMPSVPSDTYALAFANFVLEHVLDLDRAAAEILRVLRKDGVFVASTVNVSAPEFWISRHTPLWFHEFIRGKRAWPTAYSYASVDDLTKRFRSAGLEVVEVRWFPAMSSYMHRFPIVNLFARLYDACIRKLDLRSFLGNICIVVRKP